MKAQNRAQAEWDIEAIDQAIEDLREELKLCVSIPQEETVLAEIEILENAKNRILLSLWKI